MVGGACGVEVDARGAWVQGPGRLRQPGQGGAWHDDATLAVLGGRGLTLLLDGVKFMFFLWK